MRQQLEKLIQFHTIFDCYISESPQGTIPAEIWQVRVKLIKEELDEYVKAINEGDLTEVADALTDMLYILLGTFISHGLQDYAEELFNEVHASNMSKLSENGKPIFREDGKVLKGKNFFRPNIVKILHDVK